MLKKTITYEDFNGQTQTEEVYFNISRMELTEMSLEEDNLEQQVKRLMEVQDNSKILQLFKKIILSAYGERSEDGRRFMKTEEIANAFAQTAAFDELIVDLMTNADVAAEFVKGIMPAGFAEKMVEMQKVEADMAKQVNASVKPKREEMTREQLLEAWEQREKTS